MSSFKPAIPHSNGKPYFFYPYLTNYCNCSMTKARTNFMLPFEMCSFLVLHLSYPPETLLYYTVWFVLAAAVKVMSVQCHKQSYTSLYFCVPKDCSEKTSTVIAFIFSPSLCSTVIYTTCEAKMRHYFWLLISTTNTNKSSDTSQTSPDAVSEDSHNDNVGSLNITYGQIFISQSQL